MSRESLGNVGFRCRPSHRASIVRAPSHRARIGRVSWHAELPVAWCSRLAFAVRGSTLHWRSPFGMCGDLAGFADHQLVWRDALSRVASGACRLNAQAGHAVGSRVLAATGMSWRCLQAAPTARDQIRGSLTSAFRNESKAVTRPSRCRLSGREEFHDQRTVATHLQTARPRVGSPA